MQNEEHRSYDFDVIKGLETSYNFRTIGAVSYRVRFKPNIGYVPKNELWRNEFYEIVIELAAAPNPNYIPADRSIFPTIVAIISDFFDSDSRELACKRKFDDWFSRSGNHHFEKYDLPSVAAGPERYFASIFFRSDNPYRMAIISAFQQLGVDENKSFGKKFSYWSLDSKSLTNNLPGCRLNIEDLNNTHDEVQPAWKYRRISLRNLPRHHDLRGRWALESYGRTPAGRGQRYC